MELLFPARAVVPNATGCAQAVAAGGRPHHCVYGAAAAHGRRRLRVSVVGHQTARLAANPADAMPLLFATAVPPVVGILGLAAIIGAVTSSFSSSILSAASMLSWNGLKRLVWPALTNTQMSRVIRLSIVLLGAAATVFALKVRSVQALWFFTSDLVFVLLFPQLLCAHFDKKANRTGSMAAFVVSLVLRIGGGEPLLGMPALIPYPPTLPFRTFAAAAGLVLLPVVSRITARWDEAKPLTNAATAHA